CYLFFFSSRRRHTRLSRDWSSDVCSSDLELFGRATGYCHGKGGSMHIADLDLGILGANGIVAGGAPMAMGAAFASKYKGDGTVRSEERRVGKVGGLRVPPTLRVQHRNDMS